MARAIVGAKGFPIRVLVESPYAGSHGPSCDCRPCQREVARNTNYARWALGDCLSRGEAPFASHLLYTQPDVLDDRLPDDRTKGILAGLAFGEVCEFSAAYVDLGISNGMAYGFDHARTHGRPVEVRSMPGWVDDGTVFFAQADTLLRMFFLNESEGGAVQVKGSHSRVPLVEAERGEPTHLFLKQLVATATLLAQAARKHGSERTGEWTVVTVEEKGRDSKYAMGLVPAAPDDLLVL